MRRAYAVIRGPQQLLIQVVPVATLAAAVWVVAWRPGVVSVAAGVVGWGLVTSSRGGNPPRGRAGSLVLSVTGVFALLGVHAAHADAEWAALGSGTTGPFVGWIEVIDDPQPFESSTRVTVSVEGERYEYWARGRAARLRAGRWEAGHQLLVSGDRNELPADRRGRVASRHIVGRFDIDWISDAHPGDRLAVASNRVRATLRAGAAELPADQAALFRGLVIGDDSDEPPEMIDRFRASGMSHLTAVSGQNVAFVLAAAGPFLRRMRPWLRWAVTLSLIAWFVALTRFEPSIVRAGVMAAISATGFVLGRDRDPLRVLLVAVIVLVLVDPLIVTSVGFMLSVGATAGVAGLGPWLGQRMAWCGRLAEPLGVTLGAQAGVAVPAALVFGRLPLVSVPANLLSVPVAGAVMLYGLPAGLVAGAVPPIAPVVMLPCRIGVRWVDAVATVAAAVEPSPRVGVIGWCLLAAVTIAASVRYRSRAGAR